MRLTNTIKLIAASALFIRANNAFAHENHGLTVSHWHATDALGLVLLAALVVGAWWLGSRK